MLRSKWFKIGIALIVAVVVLMLSRGEQTASVLVAAHPLDAGKILTANDVTTETLPVSAVPADALTDPQQVSGQQLAVPRAKGDLLRAPMLGAPAVKLNANERGVALQVDDPAGIAGMLRPGDRVGVVALLDADTFTNTVFAPLFGNGEEQPQGENDQAGYYATPAPPPVPQNPGDYAKVLFEPLRVVYISPDFQAAEMRGDVQQQEEGGLMVQGAGPTKTRQGTVVLAVPAAPVKMVYDFATWGAGKETVPVNLVELLSALKMADGVHLSLYLVPQNAKPMTTSGVFVPQVVVLPAAPTPTPTPKGGQ